MGENQEGPANIIEKLALITDAMQNVFPNGKIICFYELREEDFKSVQNNFRQIDGYKNKFSIDLSGIEHVFVNEKYGLESLKEEPKEKPKKTLKQKLFSWFESR
jgi:hypothetical protein